MHRVRTNSEVEKKKKGDVSRNAFTMLMLRASTLTMLDSIVMLEYDVEVVVDDDALQDQEAAALQHTENPGHRASLGETLTRGKFLPHQLEVLYHTSRTTYGVSSNQPSQTLSSKQKTAENNPPDIGQKASVTPSIKNAW